MSTKTCDTCGERVQWERRAEGGQQWIALSPFPERPGRHTLKLKRLRVISARKAYLPEELARILGRGESLDDYPMHVEHKCVGRR